MADGADALLSAAPRTLPPSRGTFAGGMTARSLARERAPEACQPGAHPARCAWPSSAPSRSGPNVAVIDGRAHLSPRSARWPRSQAPSVGPLGGSPSGKHGTWAIRTRAPSRVPNQEYILALLRDTGPRGHRAQTRSKAFQRRSSAPNVCLKSWCPRFESQSRYRFVAGEPVLRATRSRALATAPTLAPAVADYRSSATRDSSRAKTLAKSRNCERNLAACRAPAEEIACKSVAFSPRIAPKRSPVRVRQAPSESLQTRLLPRGRGALRLGRVRLVNFRSGGEGRSSRRAGQLPASVKLLFIWRLSPVQCSP